MNDTTKDPLVQASLGDVELARAVRELPREDLEQVAASAIALAKKSALSHSQLGRYARRIVDHGLQTLISTLRPLPEQTAELIMDAL